ncbi:MAG: hypothetical protein GY789_24395 [Hyphomicrobiales bacterium]|nr:hypothetical protein [Hyphomicrobiales bacterium]MCP4998901.1 hypothetical protein [Hyphomicrobiales bacterium]
MKLFFDPAIRSPSQCPGTARSSTAAGLSRIDTASLTCPSPSRFRLACRDRLTARDGEVAQLLAAGNSHKEVARLLGVAPSTVRNQPVPSMKKQASTTGRN